MVALNFLTLDRGSYIIASMLAGHPLAQELDVSRGTVMATFTESTDRFLVYEDGSFTPIMA